MAGNVKLEGVEELAKLLDELPLRVEKSVVRSAARAGATVIKKAVTDRAPVHGGDRQSKTSERYGPIKSKIKLARLKRGIGYGITTGSAFYAKFIEFGFTDRAGRFHPPKPWFRPAVEGSLSDAVAKVIDSLAKGIAREAAKLAGSYAKAKRSLGVK